MNAPSDNTRECSQPAYRITREECQAKISGVCCGCGGTLEPIETVDNARNPTFWPGCLHCSVFDYGTDERVFRAARLLVVQNRLRPYSHMRTDEHQYLERRTRGAVSTVLEVLAAARDVGLVPRQGGAEK